MLTTRALLSGVYALGLGVAFLCAGVAFARAMSAFRWLRDRYQVIQIVSGPCCIAARATARWLSGSRTSWASAVPPIAVAVAVAAASSMSVTTT